MVAFVPPTSPFPLTSNFVQARSPPALGATTFLPGSACPPPARRAAAVRMALGGGGGRRFLVGGNWKCNLSRASIGELVAALNGGPKLPPEQVEVVCAPPAPYLAYVRERLRADFAVGGQNAWVSQGGAYTGEVDAAMLRDVGCDYVILGHSERRHHEVLRESDATVARKTAYAAGLGLRVILCIGELLEEREAGQTMAVCERQLKAVADAVSSWDNIVIAYEPVWAIGTGKVATPEQAQEVHEKVRAWLAANVSKDVADSTRILYGGSVNPGNCQELAKKEDVDGFLVGGASLKPTFLDIVASYSAAVASAV